MILFAHQKIEPKIFVAAAPKWKYCNQNIQRDDRL